MAEKLQKNKTPSSLEIAERLNLQELNQHGIAADSEAGREFLFRARVFGTNNVQPPRQDLNSSKAEPA